MLINSIHFLGNSTYDIMYEELTNLQLFKLVARSLHAELDSGGLNVGRSLIARLFEAFEHFYDTTTGIPSFGYHLSINQDMIVDRTLFGREIRARSERSEPSLPMRMRELSLLEDFELTYLLLLELIKYFDSQEAEQDGFNGSNHYIHIKAMILLIEIDYPTEHLEWRQDRELLIQEGEERWRKKHGTKIQSDT